MLRIEFLGLTEGKEHNGIRRVAIVMTFTAIAHGFTEMTKTFAAIVMTFTAIVKGFVAIVTTFAAIVKL